MKASTFVYPWDVNGDPEAAARIAGLGVRQATLAAAYHSTRALTPRHPRHRIVTAEHAAVLYPTDARWEGRELRPYAAGDWAPGDAFEEARAELAGAGLDVHTWVVLAHNSRMGAEHPSTSVVNAYGDRYPWAPCIAQPATRAYLVDLAVEAAVRPGAAGTELESLGWYGLQHLHAHDKTGGVPLGDAGMYLMALCFCPSCREGYGEQGADPDELAATVRTALEPLWQGAPDDEGWAGVEKLLGDRLAAATRAWRDETARTLQETAVRAVRAAAPEGFQILLHADPVTYHVGANPGVDPQHILSVADGVVVPCAGGPGLLTPFAETRKDAVIAANFPVVAEMGGSPGTLAADVARASELGATEVRLYHAGLASDGDLEAIRSALACL
ncbi:hypothetical protein [Streptomyces griseorubiginosus]|uniref:hypothetical protein n=1 Tax=Streptomyces griseorubiginosus TaxID=67304 RepID=UPI002E7FD80B|nr:hypothetical protein [Streptomyces griseorubiginosus]WUB47957.1 hypothetical protein OHN19_33300 [Streptomyces griseorubiginosus]WUB56482.1 hypothetical protein OG942_33310 [Streptomyces griseorubiginosus]